MFKALIASMTTAVVAERGRRDGINLRRVHQLTAKELVHGNDLLALAELWDGYDYYQNADRSVGNRHNSTYMIEFCIGYIEGN